MMTFDKLQGESKSHRFWELLEQREGTKDAGAEQGEE